ncbi:MAG: bifunctional metallophosphatase/5'-nucleotidase [Promethearchaeota archaeon]
MELKILYMNDLHSRYEELAKIASIIKKFKDDNTLIFDAGDTTDPWRIEVIGTKGNIISDILNYIGFNARIIGNTEGFSEKDIIGEIINSSNFPVITCNMYNMNNKKLKNLKDYVIFDVKDLKILVIGVTPAFNEFYHLFNIHIKDPIEELKRVLSKIDNAQYDLSIIISHLGLDVDEELAVRIPNIDIIIGGHSHTALNECVIENNTIICQAGSYGEYLGELIIKYDFTEKRITNFENQLISTIDYSEDPKIIEIINYNSNLAINNMSRSLYKIGFDLNHSFTEESQIGNLLADGLRDFFNSDIGIINSGVLNHGIEKGVVTKLILHEICPSPLNPTLVEIKGSDLLLTLEKSLLQGFQLSDGAGAGFRGTFLGNIQVSKNVQIFYNPAEKPLKKIQEVKINNELLDPQKWYIAGTSDYLQRGTGYVNFGNCRNEIYRPEWLRDILEKYLKKKDYIKNALIKRFIQNR